MFKKTAIAAGIGIAVSTAAVAQQTPVVVGDTREDAYVVGDKLYDTYRWEIRGDYTHGEWEADGFSDTETDAFGIEGSFYFRPVDATKGPRSEAAFLDHASDVTIGYRYAEIDDNGIDVDGDEYGISGRWVTDGGFIFEGAYARDEPLDGEVDLYRLSAGYYLTDVTSLIIDYRNADIDDGGDTDGWNARLEHFWGMGNGGLKLAGNYGYINVDDADDIDLYGLSAIWYITHDFGIGVAYDNTDFGALESETYGVFAEWFITRNIAVNLAYNHEEPDNIDNDLDNLLPDLDLEYNAITIGGRLRF